MNPVRVSFTETAARIARTLPPSVEKGVRMVIDELKVTPLAGKPLNDELEGLRSHRYKRYRIVYRLDEKRSRVEIVFIGQRQNVYDLLVRVLHKN